MINNLLDLARLEQGSRQLNLQPEQPESLLRTAADAVRPRAEDQAIEVVLDMPQGLAKSGSRLRRDSEARSGNLLDNALTYTDRGGQDHARRPGRRRSVTLSVADTGVGIPTESLPHVFEKFFRVPGQSKGGGTGFGPGNRARDRGGTRRNDQLAKARPGKGTIFRMTLPVANHQRGMTDAEFRISKSGSVTKASSHTLVAGDPPLIRHLSFVI